MVRTNYPFWINDEEGLEIEKQTFASLVDEAVQLYGADCVWINVTLGTEDPIFGEYMGKLITEGTPIRLAIEQIDTDFYPEDAGMFTKFGYNPMIGEATFNCTIQYMTHFGINPKEQDLVFYKKTNKIFEITRVEIIDGFKFKLNARHYNYDHMKIDDAVTDEDILSLKDIDEAEIVLNNDTVTTEEQTGFDTSPIVDTTKSDGVFK